jgi:hypothetical protein
MLAALLSDDPKSRAATVAFLDAAVLHQGSMQFRLAAVRALLRRTTTFDEVAEVALALAWTADSTTVDYDWGPLLVRAFPGKYAAGQQLSPTQHAYLTALVENDQCWPASRAHPIVAQVYPDFEPGPASAMEMAFLELLAESDADVAGTCNPLVWLLRAGLPTSRAEMRALVSPS